MSYAIKLDIFTNVYMLGIVNILINVPSTYVVV